MGNYKWTASFGNNTILAPCLQTLCAEIARHPTYRKCTNLGEIGDPAHQSQGTSSDHNPFVKHNGKRYVRAIDLGGNKQMLLKLRSELYKIMKKKDTRFYPYGYLKGPDSNITNWPAGTGYHRNTGDEGHLHISVTQKDGNNPSSDGWVKALDSRAPWGLLANTQYDGSDEGRAIQNSDSPGVGNIFGPKAKPLSRKEGELFLRELPPIPQDRVNAYTGIGGLRGYNAGYIADEIAAAGDVSVDYYNRPYSTSVLPTDAFKDILFQDFGTNIDRKTGKVTTIKKGVGRWYNYSEYITDASISMSWDAITEITVTMEDPNLNIWRTRGVDVGRPATYHGFPFIISATTLTEGGGGLGGVQVVLRPAAIQFLKNRVGPLSFNDTSASEFIRRECAEVGVGCIVQNTSKRGSVFRDVNTESDSEEKSSWTTFQRLAQEEGFAIFECYGVIYFIDPTFLFRLVSFSPRDTIEVWYPHDNNGPDPLLNALSVEPRRVYKTTTNAKRTSGLSDIGAVPTSRLHQTIGVPNVSHTVDFPNFATMTVTFDAPLEEASFYHVGRRLVLRRLDDVSTELKPLLISGVQYNLAGVGTLRVTAETPVRPKPTYNANDKANQRQGVNANGAGIGSALGRNPEDGAIPPGKYGGMKLNKAQAQNATNIIIECLNNAKKGIKERDIIIALITACVESTFHRYTNPQLPKTEEVPNDGQPNPGGAPFSDHSCGLFQQRDSWGTVEQRMDARQSTRLFLNRLRKKKKELGSKVEEGRMAQAVQVSAFPDRYSKKKNVARALLKAFGNSLQDAKAKVPNGPDGVGDWLTGGSKSSSKSVSNDGYYNGQKISTKRAVDMAAAALTQVDKEYQYGYNVSSLNKPRGLSQYDCSLLVQWAVYNVGVRSYPRSTGPQEAWCKRKGKRISFAKAKRTRGAVFFNESCGHTGICLGNGKTVEAFNEQLGIGKGTCKSSYRYYEVPGLKYN